MEPPVNSRPAPGIAGKDWRGRLNQTIYESNAVAGKVFDISLLVLILASILVVVLDSMQEWKLRYGGLFNILEWTFTIIFTIEHILRLIKAFTGQLLPSPR